MADKYSPKVFMEALYPFARAAEIYEQSQAAANQGKIDQAKCSGQEAVLLEPIADTARVSVTMGDCRRARAVLAALPSQEVSAQELRDMLQQSRDWLYATYYRVDSLTAEKVKAALPIIDKMIATLSSQVESALAPIGWQYRFNVDGWFPWHEMGEPIERFREVFQSEIANGTCETRHIYAKSVRV